MKKEILSAFTISSLLASSAAAAGPYDLSSINNTLFFNNVYSTGYIDGDDAYFFDGTDWESTIFTNEFLVYDGSAAVWADPGFFGHTPQMVDGTVTVTSATLSNTAITFPGIGDLTADLLLSVSEPTSGTAQVEWAWTFYHAGAAALPISFTWFMDADVFTGTGSFTDDLVAVSSNLSNSDYTIRNPSALILAVGNGITNQSVALSQSVIMDFERAPDAWYGISDPFGATQNAGDYWASLDNFSTIGPAGSGEYAVANMVAGTVENDFDENLIADTTADSGAAVTFDLSVPAGGSEMLTLYAVWGYSGTAESGPSLTAARSWQYYQ